MSEDDEFEVEEETKKHNYGVPEYLVDKDFPPLPEEIAEALGEEESVRHISPSEKKVLLKLVGKRKNAVIVLKFFYEKNDSYTAADVSRALKQYMCESTVRYILTNLCEIGLIKATKIPQLDKHTFYYTMVDKNIIGLIIKDALNRISYILAHYIPYTRIRGEELKKDKRFVEKCKYFGLTIDEGIELVKKCPKVKTTHERDTVYVERIVEGYIPPEEETKAKAKEEIEPEEVF